MRSSSQVSSAWNAKRTRWGASGAQRYKRLECYVWFTKNYISRTSDIIRPDSCSLTVVFLSLSHVAAYMLGAIISIVQVGIRQSQATGHTYQDIQCDQSSAQGRESYTGVAWIGFGKYSNASNSQLHNNERSLFTQCEIALIVLITSKGVMDICARTDSRHGFLFGKMDITYTHTLRLHFCHCKIGAIAALWNYYAGYFMNAEDCKMTQYRTWYVCHTAMDVKKWEGLQKRHL